jgi:cycloartenol synthase
MEDPAGLPPKPPHLHLHQVVEEAQAPLSEYYRHGSKGAWPFSSRDHGWPISDCSSEGLKAALMLAQLPKDKAGFHFCPQKRWLDHALEVSRGKGEL